MNTFIRQSIRFSTTAFLLASSTIAWGQGCILARQCASVFDTSSPYLKPHEWIFSSSLRWLDATRHYSGSTEQTQRDTLGTNVVNRQRLLDLSGNYQVTDADSVVLSIPILLRGSWSVPLPVATGNPRYTQRAAGIGDVVATVRHWVHDVNKFDKENYSLGLGLKLPTGNPHAMAPFPDLTGGNIISRPVDQSIQPGDGGWGFNTEFNAFKLIGKFNLFASGTYLINPKNVNGTPSILSVLNNGVLTPANEYRRYNSVPDQYLARVGFAFPFSYVKGSSFSLSGRIEGVPVKDLFGPSDGWRRPGYEVFIEPGFAIHRGNEMFSISTPVGLLRRREPDSMGNKGDATFADYLWLLGYSRKFGK